ncbi:hypothetical protein [Oceanibaculum indicum]|uniref:Uncharacterized protein n=1 Tax=Oceanibaculum indicum P24 TaxID=1207063 RepID=K2IFE1_9PROT|nr:hypothetical protein [Oceanibaculum indicum]EKE68696.1 hypothetical protein P24_17182 [Oceanibaculum indicum P24]
MATKTITMTETKPGSPDGATVNTYEKGVTYEDMPDALADEFLRAKWAVEGTGKKKSGTAAVAEPPAA